MDRIELGTKGRTTTRLGFGCSSLMGAMGRRESSAMLETAFDAGIRHFDVAPMYGFGHAEGCLGEFLGRHRGEVTVTTKYGIPPVRGQGWMGLARAAARPVGRALPGGCCRRAPWTTKYGIPPVRGQGWMGLARAAARPVVRALPGLKRGMAQVAGSRSEEHTSELQSPMYLV